MIWFMVLLYDRTVEWMIIPSRSPRIRSCSLFVRAHINVAKPFPVYITRPIYDCHVAVSHLINISITPIHLRSNSNITGSLTLRNWLTSRLTTDISPIQYIRIYHDKYTKYTFNALRRRNRESNEYEFTNILLLERVSNERNAYRG